MASFHEFLLSRFEQGGMSTEDVLASFLPLARQVVQAHAVGKVAPLDGIDTLQVEGVQIWYPDSAIKPPQQQTAKLRLLDKPLGGVEIMAEQKRSIDVDEGRDTVNDLLIGARDQEISKPVYLPGYISWEQQIGHHDPLADVFCLGIILASLTCGLDFNQPDDLQSFVKHRRNLFRISPQLHPVLAKAIVRMTELSRHRRPQDLATLVSNLENYRDQAVDFDFDLASTESGTGIQARRKAVLSRLQQRLFEISRRNRLLHFRPTLSAVNLTHASVPLAFDVQSIRPEQILTWKGEFARTIAGGKPVALNRYLNFAEQLYVPSVLDRIRADAVRDAAEFGFEQLRLAICMLHWANVKESPPEHYDSPLILLPVRLVKKKGVRDSYWLQPLTTEAELNPVVRHLFRQLYGLELPATIDLAETTLDQLYEDLAGRITASEPGITLNKVDRPRIDLIHAQAKRRLAHYQRSARLSGRGIRSFMDVDYSYNPVNFHPLGLAIFRAKVRPSPTNLREIVQQSPTPRSYAVAPAEDETPASAKTKQFYALREQADDNPYNWEFDLCRMTLGNFKYRRMTLVRDYADLVADGVKSPAFEAVFSLAPRPVESGTPTVPPLEERYHIVSCDPTQATAIGLARSGANYIIQGPPGTGKSQTITNLIADYVMQGKRVLFVCEKRAAIDVVYARLRQQGLHQLCCLIHDSQTDKKEFVLDLKATYETLLTEQQTKPRAWQLRRVNLLHAMQMELEPLEQFNQAMLSSPVHVGLTVRELFERAMALADAMPRLSAAQNEILPDYAAWLANGETIASLVAAITDIQKDGILAHHPLCRLNPAVAEQDRPMHFVTGRLQIARQLVEKLGQVLRASGVPEEHWQSLAVVAPLLDYAAKVEPLARLKIMGLLDEHSDISKRFTQAAKQHMAAQAALKRVQEATRHWIDKLPEVELSVALEQAKTMESKRLAFLNPIWWRLRKVMYRRYRFDAHTIKPSWSQVLTTLDSEYRASAAVVAARRAIGDAIGMVEPPDDLQKLVEDTRHSLCQLPPALRSLHQELTTSEQAPGSIAALIEAAGITEQLQAACAHLLATYADRLWIELQQDLKAIESSLDVLPDFLHCLTQLAHLPSGIAGAFRLLPLGARELEAAIVARGVDQLLRTDRVLSRFNGAVRDGHVQRLLKLSVKWHEVNARAVIEKVRQGFLEHVRVASQPAAALTSEQKEFKIIYNRGRRELEHEFGKVMRHKSIRDMVAGDSGIVIADLKPVWLMSPLSVSDTLPLRPDQFDVVIFDEASQIPLEEAVPSVFRAPQTIVVGDEMQLPPTNFFSAKNDGQDEEDFTVSEGGQVFEYDLSSNSFLNHAARNLPSRMLGWHYRSRSESLISFSNWAFYQGKLLTVPEQRLAVSTGSQILINSPGEGVVNVARVLERPISFHYLARGVYDNRRNRAEADYIAQIVRGMLRVEAHPSIGIVAFSEAQQSEIESSLSRLGNEDKVFAEQLEAEYEREIDGQYAGLLIKNLENIQGDERDIVILSICYGRDPEGKMRMNFGPINQSGGEKRLNVAFSRAKHHMAVISSIRHSDITNEYNDGASCLRSYLQYADVCSSGQVSASHRVLREMAVWKDLAQPEETKQNVTVRQIAVALQQRGYAVELGIGMSHFRCDLAARRHGENEHRLGIMVDTEMHYQQTDLLEREMMRPQLLRSFGWNIAHVLQRDWYSDRQAVLDRLTHLIEDGSEPSPADLEETNEDDPWGDYDTDESAENQLVSPVLPQSQSDDEVAANQSVPAVAGIDLPNGATCYLEYIVGASRKFWEVTLNDRAITVRFGRIGSSGQTQVKNFVSEDMARRNVHNLIAEKLRKGYMARPASA